MAKAKKSVQTRINEQNAALPPAKRSPYLQRKGATTTAPRQRAVSWGLSAERIKARKPYCADPDVHGAECVCLTVQRDRKRPKGSRVGQADIGKDGSISLTGTKALGVNYCPDSDVHDSTCVHQLPDRSIGEVSVADIIELLLTMPGDVRFGVSMDGGADHERGFRIEPNENGVWLCIEELKSVELFEYKPGDRVKVKADPKEDTVEEIGTFNNYDAKDNGCCVVTVDKRYRKGNHDTGRRELGVEQIEFIAPDKLAGEDHDRLMRAINIVWNSIGDDVEQSIKDAKEKLDNDTAVETCIDADRLSTNGGEDGPMMHTLVNELIRRYGYRCVLTYIGEHCTLA